MSCIKSHFKIGAEAHEIAESRLIIFTVTTGFHLYLHKKREGRRDFGKKGEMMRDKTPPALKEVR